MLSHFRTFLQSSERDLQGKEGSNVEGEKGAWDLIKTESDVIHEKKKKKKLDLTAGEMLMVLEPA